MSTTRRRLEASVDEIDHAIKELRTAIFTLTQPNDGALRDQLLQTVSERVAVLGFRPSVTFDGVVDHLDATIVGHATATLNEALSNVARHARATRVDVRVRADAVSLTIDVIDDGVGIPDDGHRGNGLANMASRARQLGGDCEITRNADRGCTLTWHIPID